MIIDDYLNVFNESLYLKIKFSSAKLRNNCVIANVNVIVKEQN